MIVYCISVIIILLCVLDYVFKNNTKTKLVRKIPGKDGMFFFGNALDVHQSPADFFKMLRNMAASYNGIYSFYAFFLRHVNIYNPDDIEVITGTIKHTNKSTVYKVLKPWLNEGLLLSSGAKWQSRRKILTPTFHFNILKRFWSILEENSQRLIENLAKTEGQVINITPIISEYTLSSICETAMGTRLHEKIINEGKTYKDAIYELGDLCFTRVVNVILLVDFIFNLSSISRRTYKLLDTIKSFTRRVINERKEYLEKNGIKINENMDVKDDDEQFASSKKKRIAMLDLLISAEQDGIIDTEGVQEEVDTFMLEGHDTTAAGLTFGLMLLANNKHVQEKITAELDDIFQGSNRAATMEDLTHMKYLECVIKEVLRLYPPVPLIGRQASETVNLSNYTVPEGAEIQIHIYDLHRREDLYKNAHVFDPDRFLPENSVGRHPYAYIPFSAGPRNCIGQRFALMEMKSCLAAVLRNFKLEPVTRPEDINFICDIVLRSTGPVEARFIKRNK